MPVVAPVGAVATIDVALQLPIVVAVVPLNCTVLEPCVEPKFVPVIVTEAPTAPEVGDRLVMLGADTTVNDEPLLATPLTVTTTFPVVAPVGTVATIEVALQLPIVVAAVPLNFTVLVPCVAPKFVPVIVTDAPTAPEVGDRLVMLGVGNTVKEDPLLLTPLAWTTTLPVVAPVGTVATIDVALQLPMVVAAVPLNATVLEPWVEPKFVPVIVTDAPTAPEVGDKLRHHPRRTLHGNGQPIQTVRVPAIDYEDPFYLVHSPYVRVNAPFSRLPAVWTEPYFANFHPVTTTTWAIDRALSDKNKPFDSLPFRMTHLLYAAMGASLLIPLYRRLGLPAILSVLGALLFAVHPIHTEVVAWLSARKDLISLIFIVLSFLSWRWATAASTPGEWRLRHAVAVLLALLAVLSKPIAVILPALFVAYEFCSAPHASITSWRWTQRHHHPLLTRVLTLTAIFLSTGGVSTAIFRRLLAKDSMHGGWLILVPIGLLCLLAVAPAAQELATFRDGSTAGIRVLGPPFVILSVVFGAGSAWTFWAQQQVGAIKGGLSLLPTLNLTFDAMLAYAGKSFIPAHMTVSYAWSEYPYLSLKGLLGVALIYAAVGIGMRLAGARDRNQRLIAFGIFWYLIALVPVSNLIPTSTKMADRYLFVPTIGTILTLLALAAMLLPKVRWQQLSLYCALTSMVVSYAAWSYKRTEVWCGKTTEWNDRPQPDLSLWTAAVENDPENTFALNSLGLAYLRLNPPEADKALLYLNRALQNGETSQSKIAGNQRLVLTPVYEGLGDGYLTQTSRLDAGKAGSPGWHNKKQAYANAVTYFELASEAPSGFASSDARVLSRFAEACEGKAQMDAQELATATPEQRAPLIRERDELRGKSQESMQHARDILTAGNVTPADPNYRTVILGQGNIIFGREVGASNEEKVIYYRQALVRYQEAASLLPDDPRPLLYEGLCYERLTGIAQSPEEKRERFALGEAALRKALTLNVDAPDYSSGLAYRALASLYAHVNDFQSVLDSLKKAQQADPVSADSGQLDREIQSVEQYLAR